MKVRRQNHDVRNGAWTNDTTVIDTDGVSRIGTCTAERACNVQASHDDSVANSLVHGKKGSRQASGQWSVCDTNRSLVYVHLIPIQKHLSSFAHAGHQHGIRNKRQTTLEVSADQSDRGNGRVHAVTYELKVDVKQEGCSDEARFPMVQWTHGIEKVIDRCGAGSDTSCSFIKRAIRMTKRNVHTTADKVLDDRQSARYLGRNGNQLDWSNIEQRSGFLTCWSFKISMMEDAGLLLAEKGTLQIPTERPGTCGPGIEWNPLQYLLQDRDRFAHRRRKKRGDSVGRKTGFHCIESFLCSLHDLVSAISMRVHVDVTRGNNETHSVNDLDAGRLFFQNAFEPACFNFNPGRTLLFIGSKQVIGLDHIVCRRWRSHGFSPFHIGDDQALSLLQNYHPFWQLVLVL